MACTICHQTVTEGIIVEQKVLCSSCNKGRKICPRCQNYMLIAATCYKCQFMSQSIKCQTCQESVSEGFLKDGYFLCLKCLDQRQAQRLGLNECQKCHHWTAKWEETYLSDNTGRIKATCNHCQHIQTWEY